MLEIIHTISGSEVRNKYLSSLEEFSRDKNRTVMVHHFGEFSQDLINGLTDSIEDVMISNGDSKKTRKRIFSILIEGLQNIKAHGEKDENGFQLAYLMIVKTKEEYSILMGNLIQEKEKETLENYFQRINDMSPEKLKELYLEILNNSFFTRKGGAGLGFLTMRLKSEQKLAYSIQRISEKNCFFTVEVTINRNL